MDAIVIDGESVSDAVDVTANVIVTVVVITTVLAEPAAIITIAAILAVITTATTIAAIPEAVSVILVPLTIVAVAITILAILVDAVVIATDIATIAGAIVPVSAMDTIRDIRMVAMPVEILVAMVVSCLFLLVTDVTPVIKQEKTTWGVNLKRRTTAGGHMAAGCCSLLGSSSQTIFRQFYISTPGLVFCHALAFSSRKNIE